MSRHASYVLVRTLPGACTQRLGDRVQPVSRDLLGRHQGPVRPDDLADQSPWWSSSSSPRGSPLLPLATTCTRLQTLPPSRRPRGFQAPRSGLFFVAVVLVLESQNLAHCAHFRTRFGAFSPATFLCVVSKALLARFELCASVGA